MPSYRYDDVSFDNLPDCQQGQTWVLSQDESQMAVVRFIFALHVL